jgi:hypothetical protein
MQIAAEHKGQTNKITTAKLTPRKIAAAIAAVRAALGAMRQQFDTLGIHSGTLAHVLRAPNFKLTLAQAMDPPSQSTGSSRSGVSRWLACFCATGLPCDR